MTPWYAEKEDTILKGLWGKNAGLLSENRKQRMLQVASLRTRKIRLVLQDIHQPHNISACLRSADAFGIQNIDIVTMGEKFKPTTVSRGVGEWLTTKHFLSIESCARSLKEQGFTLLAGMPHKDALPLDMLNLTKPCAILFGNEHSGVSSEWKPFVDQYFTIPMVGMVESLNISVSAAISLYSLTQRSSKHWGEDYALTPAEQKDLLDYWMYKRFPFDMST